MNQRFIRQPRRSEEPAPTSGAIIVTAVKTTYIHWEALLSSFDLLYFAICDFCLMIRLLTIGSTSHAITLLSKSQVLSLFRSQVS